jgi:hypothetical protein
LKPTKTPEHTLDKARYMARLTRSCSVPLDASASSHIGPKPCAQTHPAAFSPAVPEHGERPAARFCTMSDDTPLHGPESRFLHHFCTTCRFSLHRPDPAQRSLATTTAGAFKGMPGKDRARDDRGPARVVSVAAAWSWSPVLAPHPIVSALPTENRRNCTAFAPPQAFPQHRRGHDGSRP